MAAEVIEKELPANVLIHDMGFSTMKVEIEHTHDIGCGCYVLAVAGAAWATMLAYFIIKWVG